MRVSVTLITPRELACECIFSHMKRNETKRYEVAIRYITLRYDTIAIGIKRRTQFCLSVCLIKDQTTNSSVRPGARRK